MDRGYIQRNDESRARLRALLDRLTDDDLRARVGDWSVAMSLAHLAFWDRFTHLRWVETVASGRAVPVSTGSPQTDLVNEANVDLWARALDAAGIRAFVVEAAEDLDAHVAALPDALVEAAQAAGMDRHLDRSRHREDHLAPIEAAFELR
ncbi:MAG: DinB family protein [Chloroflexota bacterium]|jgi:hypothetical protein